MKRRGEERRHRTRLSAVHHGSTVRQRESESLQAAAAAAMQERGKSEKRKFPSNEGENGEMETASSAQSLFHHCIFFPRNRRLPFF